MTAVPFDSLTVKFEVSWSTDPFAATSYVDETAYVRGFTVNRGRQTEFDTFPAGTMTVDIDNSTRRFDPLYTAGALYGTILPRKKCRLTLTYSGTDYIAFTGFLDGVPQQGEPSNTLGLAQLAATDGFKMLARARLPYDPTPVGNGETIGARVGRLLDYASWPAGDRDIDLDSPTMIQSVPNGEIIMERLYVAAAGDLGQFFIAKDGKATYRGHRWQLANNLTATATLGETVSSGEIPYSDYTMTYDDQQIFNRATGRCYTPDLVLQDVVDVSDSTSVTAYGESAKDLGTVTINNPNVLTNTLEWIVAYFKDAKLRVGQVTLNPRATPSTMYPVVLGAEIGTRWTFKRRPQNVGSAISQDVIVQGISYTMSPDSFTASFVLSQAPATPAGNPYWRMGVSLWNSTTVWA